MYQVRQDGKTIEQFSIFTDAWLFAYLELRSFVRIIGPEGTWYVNPGQHYIN